MKSPEEARQVIVRLTELAENSAELKQFAEARLLRMSCPASLAEDVLQRAFQSVLQGLETEHGRKPRREDVESSAVFMCYMRGVINSQLYAMMRQREFNFAHLPVRDGREGREGDLGERERGVVLGAPETVRTEAHVEDLKRMLFGKLHAQARPALLPTIRAWERVFEYTDRIPDGGRPRKYVAEVRELAQQIVHELGGLR
jgi:hypothetical protein